MNTKPEALRLADWLDGHSNGPMDAKHEAAAELRRLHEENEKLATGHLKQGLTIAELYEKVDALHDDLENAQRHFAETMQAYQDEIKANETLLKALTFIAESEQDWSMLEATQESLREHMAIIKADTVLLRQALEALENGKRVRNCEGGTLFQPPLEEAAITALRERLGEKA